MVELHGELKEFIGESGFLGDSVGGEEIVPASGVDFFNVEESAFDHFAEESVGKFDAASELGRGHSRGKGGGSLDVFKDFELVETVLGIVCEHYSLIHQQPSVI